MATRADFQSIDFMMEAVPGTNPGIVGASYVDGTDTTEGKYVPNLTNADKAFALLADKIEGLPDIKGVEVKEAKVVREYANKRLSGLKSEGSITLPFVMHGWAGTPASQRPAPPPWLQLASSGTGHIFGNVAAVDAGGAATTMASATTITTGALLDGHVFAIKDATDNTIQLVRPDDATGTTLSGSQIGTSFTVVMSDPAWFSAQAHFDTRNDLIGPVGGSYAPTTYTILVHRSDIDACQIFKGCRCEKFSIDTKVGEVPVIKVTMTYQSWTSYTDGGADWSGYAIPTDKPKYGAVCYDDVWPSPEITTAANFVWMDGATRTAPHISSFTFEYDAGYQKYMANTGTQGVAGVFPAGQQKATAKWSVLFDSDWRDYINDAPFPFIYWQGTAQGKIWFCGMTAAVMTEGPGFDKEVDNLLANEISVEAGDYCDDADAYTAGKPAQCIAYLGVI